MASEKEILIAFLFKRSGKKEMSFSDLYLTLSMDLNWTTPEDAKKFVNDAIKKKLLIKEGEHVSPAFDVNKIIVPVGFSPSKKLFLEKKDLGALDEKDFLKQVIKRISEKTGLNEQEIKDKISTISKEKNLKDEVAALLFGKEHDLEIDDFLKELEEKIF